MAAVSESALEVLPDLPHHALYDHTMQKEYRKLAWRTTHEIGLRGFYTAPGTGARIPVTFSEAAKGVTGVSGDAAGIRSWKPKPDLGTDAEIAVIRGDCVETAAALAAGGFNPLLMDAASRTHFGGGYKSGSAAQEEEVCRRTTLAFAVDTSLKVQKNGKLYPLAPQNGIYVPNVMIFRKGAAENFACMDAPQRCAVGIVSAHNRPPLSKCGTAIEGPCATDAEAMLRTFFHMGCTRGHDAVVAVALGCGAFRNPATFVASTMMKVVKSYRRSYKLIVISVFDDRNSAHEFNPLGNFLPFALAASDPSVGGRVFGDVSRSTEITREELEGEAAARMTKK